MARKKANELRTEARARFEHFIAAELETHPDVGTDSLARNFYAREEPLLKKIAGAVIISILVKWADDILSQSVAVHASRNGRGQLALPLNLQGIELSGAFSFLNGANKIRFVANYKATLFHLDSHAQLLRKHEDE